VRHLWTQNVTDVCARFGREAADDVIPELLVLLVGAVARARRRLGFDLVPAMRDLGDA
jgi:hypothetical protein